MGTASAVVAVPSSYMNESGGPVAGLMKFFKVPFERLVVIHDDLDLDLDFGRIRLGRGMCCATYTAGRRCERVVVTLGLASATRMLVEKGPEPTEPGGHSR